MTNDLQTQTEAIQSVVDVHGIYMMEPYEHEAADHKFWQLACETIEQYEHARAHLLLFGLNVGETKFQPLTGFHLFRVYPDGKEVDNKHDLEY